MLYNSNLKRKIDNRDIYISLIEKAINDNSISFTDKLNDLISDTILLCKENIDVSKIKSDNISLSMYFYLYHKDYFLQIDDYNKSYLDIINFLNKDEAISYF